MKTPEELEKEINERAQRIMMADRNASYEDFKKAQNKDLLKKEIPERVEELEVFDHNGEKKMPAVEIENSIPVKNGNQVTNKNVIKFAGYGGFWSRLAASILERIILMVVIGVATGILFISMDKNIEGNMRSYWWKDVATLIIPVLLILSFYVYNIYLYFKDGQSIGYKMLGLKVIDKSTGKKPSTGKLLGRFGIKALLTWIPYVNLIGYIVIGSMIAFTGKKEGPHDKASGTLVVSEKESKAWIIVIVIAGIFGVIAVIGILAGILFVAINPTEQVEKANKATTRALMSQINTQAMMYYNEDSTFENFCNTITEPDLICNDNEEEFVVFAPRGEKTYCIDSRGFNDEIDVIDMDKTSCE